MDLSPTTCCYCPVPPSIAVGLILISLAILAIGRFLASRLGGWGRRLGQTIAGVGVAFTVLALLPILRFGVWSRPAQFQMEVVPWEQTLFGVLRLLIPILWLAAAIVVWIYAGRRRACGGPVEEARPERA